MMYNAAKQDVIDLHSPGGKHDDTGKRACV